MVAAVFAIFKSFSAFFCFLFSRVLGKSEWMRKTTKKKIAKIAVAIFFGNLHWTKALYDLRDVVFWCLFHHHNSVSQYREGEWSKRWPHTERISAFSLLLHWALVYSNIVFLFCHFSFPFHGQYRCNLAGPGVQRNTFHSLNDPKQSRKKRKHLGKVI